MKIAITAASGQLGAAIVHATTQLVGADSVVAVARTPAKAQGLGVEVRSGSYALMAPGVGPRSAELKVRGAIDGFIEITPTNPADGPSYAGTYSERVVGWLTDPDTDTFRVAHLRLHGRLGGSDGTSVMFEGTFKLTLKPDGTAVVDRQSITCR